jgi:ATP-binding cassette subfamily C protein CydD
LGPSATQGEHSGELVNTLGEGVEALDAYFSQYLPQLVLAALVPLAVLVVVFPRDVLSGVLLLVTAPLIPLFMVLIGSAAETLTRRQWASLSRLSAHFLDVLQGLVTLKLFGRSREQIEAIRAITGEYRDTTLSVLRVTFLSALVLEMVGTISTAMVAVQIGLRLLYARLSFADALFILLLAPEYYLPLRMLGARFHAGMAGVAAARRIFELLETPLPAASRAAAAPPAQMQIRFDEVHYAYEGGQRPALNGVTLAIEPGQQVALVGPSGAGKSTVAALLLRFIEPSAGTITVDGVPLAAIDTDAWRGQIAWVPQRPALFSDTIAANIRLARPGADSSAVRRAAEMAAALDFIEELPQGFETIIGEHGVGLSAGQAQRVALARAFLRDAPFVVLDEATAHLDPAHEALIRDAMRRLLAGRTALVIAHRLPTVIGVDRVIVLDRGRVAQSGAHRDLIGQPGLYRQLVAAYGGGE